MNSQDKWAKPEDWVRFRTIITDLYMTHSLSEVLRIMREEHNFHATPKMFQRQIYQIWGLEKGRSESRKNSKRPRTDPGPEMGTSSAQRDSSTQGSSRSQGIPSTVNSGDQREPIPPLTSAQNRPTVPGIDQPGYGAGSQRSSTRSVDASLASGSSRDKWMATVMIRKSPSPTPAPRTMQPLPHAIRTSPGNRSPRSGALKRTRQSPNRSPGGPRSQQTQRSVPRSSRVPKAYGKLVKARMTLPAGTLRHLQSPDAILVPEKSMFYARHYISSAFVTGAWPMTDSVNVTIVDPQCIKLDGWFNDFNPGFIFLAKKRIRKAYRIYRRCFLATYEILMLQDPRFVIYICQQAIRFLYWDKTDTLLATSLLRYVCKLSTQVFTAQHPLSVFLAQLARMDNVEFSRNIKMLMECYFDHLEPFIDPSGEAYKFINNLRGMTISLMESTHIIPVDEARPALETLIARADESGHSSLHLRIEITAVLQRNMLLAESRALLEEIRASEEAPNDPYEFVYAGFVLMRTQRFMKDLDAVIRTGREVVDYLFEANAHQRRRRANPKADPPSPFDDELFRTTIHSSLLLALGMLEADLRAADRVEESDKVHTQLEAVMNDQYGVDRGSTPEPDVEIGELR
ncbi:hypothetical protein BX600DRAFT_513509 [Xylariales sp. PMI_506]|nr:hypothetical protein BX600DRAFT_513509 [Xylariales sp. PMI_506]